MNKIIEKLLTVTFPTVEIANLLEIVSATPNPQLATEILCGLYVEPIFPNKVKEKSGDKVLTFSSFCKWQNKVKYTYIKEKTISGYFPKGTIKSDITLENFKQYEESWKSGADQLNISLKTGETVLDDSYCSSETWLSYTTL